MGRTHEPCPEEFRRQVVELVRASRNPHDLAREFEPPAEAIRSWVRQADRDEGRSRSQGSDGPTTSEREELARLRSDDKQFRLERDILARPRPGSHGRLARSRPGLPVHEGEPGRVPDQDHGAGAWCVAPAITLGRLAPPPGISLPSRAVTARPHRPCGLARDVRRPAGPCRAEGPGRSGWPQARRPPHAVAGPA